MGEEDPLVLCRFRLSIRSTVERLTRAGFSCISPWQVEVGCRGFKVRRDRGDRALTGGAVGEVPD